MTDAPGIQALVWYKEEDWQQLRELFSDSHLLPVKYADWLARAEANEKSVRESGDIVIKVFIDPVTFPAWCKKKKRKLDAESRTLLAIEVATQQQFGDKV